MENIQKRKKINDSDSFCCDYFSVFRVLEKDVCCKILEKKLCMQCDMLFLLDDVKTYLTSSLRM